MVGDILTQSHASITIYIRSYFNAVEYIHHDLCTFVETFGVFGSPPIFQVTVLVVLATLIVETVSHLMADYHADSTIVESIIRIHIEERILQDAGRETDFISGRVVISVYGLRSHQPFVFIHRFTGFSYHFGMIPLVGTFHVCPVRIILDFQSRIIFPLVGIPDFYMESGQLF